MTVSYESIAFVRRTMKNLDHHVFLQDGSTPLEETRHTQVNHYPDCMGLCNRDTIRSSSFLQTGTKATLPISKGRPNSTRRSLIGEPQESMPMSVVGMSERRVGWGWSSHQPVECAFTVILSVDGCARRIGADRSPWSGLANARKKPSRSGRRSTGSTETKSRAGEYTHPLGRRSGL